MSIFRKFAGTWINLVPRTKNGQIKSDTNAVNEVTVALVDNFGALFINNVKVQEFRGQPPQGGGAVGLYAESESTVSDEWRFLDIAVMDNGKSKPVVLPPAPSGPTIADCRPVNTTDFQDTFAKPDPAWGFNDPAAHYVDGQLLLKPNENRSYTQLYRALVFKNATVCVTVKSPPEVNDLEGISLRRIGILGKRLPELLYGGDIPKRDFQRLSKGQRSMGHGCSPDDVGHDQKRHRCGE